MTERREIALADFLRTGIRLVEEAGNIIRNVYAKRQFMEEIKDAATSDRVTIADLQVQRNVEYVISALYPGLRYIGEEDRELY